MKIAVIDDDSAIMMLLELSLQSAGHEICPILAKADGGSDMILDQLLCFQPEAVLLDFNLPNIHPFELKDSVCQALSLGPQKVIFLTASPERVSDEHPCIAKPFSPLHIADQVYAMVNQAHTKDNLK